MPPSSSSARAASANRATSDAMGHCTFHFDALPPGDYAVHVVGRNAIPTRQVAVVAGAHIPLVLPWVGEPDP